MITAFNQKTKRSSTNPFGLDPAKNPWAQGAGTPEKNTGGGGPIPLNLGDDWSGWKINNWALQYDTLPWLRDQIMLSRKLQPQREDAILGMIAQLTNPQAMADQQRALLRGNAIDEGQRTGYALAQQSPAASTALRQGAMLDARNQAASQASDFDTFLQSPQGRMEALQAILAAINGAYDQNAQNAYQGITDTALGVEDLNLRINPPKKGGGLLGGLLGTALGAVTGGGGGWEQLLGAFAGGSNGGSQNPDGASGTGQSRVRRVRR